MASGPQPIGALRVVGGADLTRQIDQEAQQRAALSQPAPDPTPVGLAGYILTQYELMRRHRNNSMSGWAERLLKSLRAFNGQYDPDKLAEIKKFAGSDAYARVIAIKCRGASSLLRDVYLGADLPWGIDPPTDPQVPPDVLRAMEQLIRAEMQSLHQQGQPIDPSAIRDRATDLMEAARQVAKAKASKQAIVAQDKLQEILSEGGFYTALAEFIIDLPANPYACIKGPTVRLRTDVRWQNGKATVTTVPKLVWARISPFDIYWTPGASDIEDANIIERSRLTRKDLNDCLDLPGYNVDAVRSVLDEYGRGGIVDNWDQTDSERAIHENREDPRFNQSGMLSCLEFQGYARGVELLQAGIDPEQIEDPLRDYFVQAWLIGRYVLKVQIAPSPRKRHQYFITSFEKTPGSPIGNGLPDILEDLQNVCNAILRAMVNNLSIASGPQVVVNDDRMQDVEDNDSLYPWKRWHVRNHPMANNTEPPVSFFMPTNISQELAQIYSMFSELADEHSAIPKYMTGAAAGGAGRTASGLSMLMGNSAKILQTVAANIDHDVISPALTALFDMVVLTDTSGLLSGEEDIRVMGVNVAVQKETQRQRQLEALQITANPIDMQIIGPKGRAELLRPVLNTVGLPGNNIVPSADQLDAMQKQAAALAQAQGQPGHGGMGPQAAQAQGNQQTSPVNGNVGPVTNVVGPQAQPAIGGGSH